MKSSTKGMLAALLLISASSAAFADAPPYNCTRDGAVYDVVRDAASGTIVHSSSGECVRTHWVVDHDPCTDAPVAQAPHHHPSIKILSKEDQTVYFGFNKASLEPEMIARLDALATNLKGNSKVVSVRISGFADRIGNAGYNNKLSQKRAENVRQYLIAKGLVTAPLTKTKWVGSKEAKANCPEKLKRADLIECLKKDRRVEIEVDYAPDIHTAE